MRIRLLVLALLLFGACAPRSGVETPGPVRLRVDPHLQQIAVTGRGEGETSFEASLWRSLDYYRLLAVSRSRDGFAGYAVAYDEAGRELDLVVERVTTPRGVFLERLSVYLPRAYVRGRAGEGVMVLAVGEREETVLRMPGQMLRQSLAMFDEALAEHGAELPARQVHIAPPAEADNAPSLVLAGDEPEELFGIPLMAVEEAEEEAKAGATPRRSAPAEKPGEAEAGPAEKTPPADADQVVVERRSAAGGEVIVYRNLRFMCGKSALLPRFKRTLDGLARELAQRPELGVVVEGHTCNVGPDAVNLRLSRERAEAVREYLVDEHGVEASRITAVGRGERAPEFTNDTKYGRAMNRRVEVRLAR
ncbi:MAG: OmpA family protein [Desulfovibrionaceae bacterium]